MSTIFSSPLHHASWNPCKMPPQVYHHAAAAAAKPDHEPIFDHKQLIEDCRRRRVNVVVTSSTDEAKNVESIDLDEALDQSRFVHLKAAGQLKVDQSASGHLAASRSSQSSQCSSLECLSSDEGYVGSYSSSSDHHLRSASGHSKLTNRTSPSRVQQDDKINSQLVYKELEQLLSFLAMSDEQSPVVNDDHHHVTIPDILSAHKAPFERDSELQGDFRSLLDHSAASQLDRQSVWLGSEQPPVHDTLTASTSGALREEFRREDLIDTNAYLNEIEMNVDYFRSEIDELYQQHVHSSYWDSDPLSADSMLTYKSNRDAFNLRACHRTFVLEPKPQTAIQSSGTFANIQVDSIPEFIPPAQMKLTEPAEPVVVEHELYDDGDEAADDQTGAYYGEDEDYYGGGEEPDDYEYEYFQMTVDTMSEREALDLLASQSEQYALQMAQAAKLGLSVVEPDLTASECPASELVAMLESSPPSSSDMDNIFSCDDDWAGGTGGESISSKSSSAWSSLASEQAESSLGEASSEYPGNLTAAAAAAATGGSNLASLSLRTSLLKLLQTRQHLGRLLRQKQAAAATSNSSASSSLTTSSVFLNKTNFQPAASTSKKPCVHKLNDGHCSRADCRFAHDFKNITCKYWLDGECLKGEACEFLHDIVEQPAACFRSSQGRRASLSSNSSTIFGKKSSAKKAAKQPDFKLDTEEFPALGGPPVTVTVVISVESEPAEVRPMTLAAKIKSNMDKKPKAAAAAVTKLKEQTTGAALTSSNKTNQMVSKPSEWTVKNENKPCEKPKTSQTGAAAKKVSNVTIANYGIEILSNNNNNNNNKNSRSNTKPKPKKR